MKTNLRALSGRELKPILAYVREQWGADVRFPWAWYLSAKNDVFLVTRDIVKIVAKKLRINSLGLYFGEYRNGGLRLSIEGSQLVGPLAKKNVVELDDEEFRQWLRGEDLEKAVGREGFVIIRHGTDFAGCGRVKDGKILNFVPKARRLVVD